MENNLTKKIAEINVSSDATYTLPGFLGDDAILAKSLSNLLENEKKDLLHFIIKSKLIISII